MNRPPRVHSCSYSLVASLEALQSIHLLLPAFCPCWPSSCLRPAWSLQSSTLPHQQLPGVPASRFGDLISSCVFCKVSGQGSHSHVPCRFTCRFTRVHFAQTTTNGVWVQIVDRVSKSCSHPGHSLNEPLLLGTKSRYTQDSTEMPAGSTTWFMLNRISCWPPTGVWLKQNWQSWLATTSSFLWSQCSKSDNNEHGVWPWVLTPHS